MPFDTNSTSEMIRPWFCLVWLSASLIGLPNANADELTAALNAKLPRPNLVLSAIDSDDPDRRRSAAIALAKWHRHVPGAVVCLRRLVNDQDTRVAAAAVEAATNIGSREAFAVIADSLDRRWSPDQMNAIADALDRRDVRPFWKRSDEFGVRDRIDGLIQQRCIPYNSMSIDRIEFPKPSREVVESGREVFITAGCVSCHQVNGYGKNTSGVNLAGVGQCYDNELLAKQILFPSLDIHDAGIQERIVTVDGEIIVGRVRQVHSERLGIQTDPAQPEHLLWIHHNEIEHRSVSPISAMPTGLLSSLTPTQVADLVVFLRTDGGLVPMPSGMHHDH